jgi:hypothetical protein
MSVLSKLFADEHAAYRHRMGLSRSDFGAFYAPTEHADGICAQKRAILDSPSGAQRLLITEPGQRPLAELAGLLGAPPDPSALSLAIEPDWLILIPPDWRLAAAGVCFPTRWSLAGKALQTVEEIHGIVPRLNPSLGQQIGAFFARLTPGEGWTRSNWGLSSNGNLDQHPDAPYQALTSQMPLAQVFIRVESQHLLKMPQTGALVFGIRILNFPLEEAAHDPHLAAALKESLRTMPADIAAYKGIPADFWQRL